MGRLWRRRDGAALEPTTLLLSREAARSTGRSSSCPMSLWTLSTHDCHPSLLRRRGPAPVLPFFRWQTRPMTCLWRRRRRSRCLYLACARREYRLTQHAALCTWSHLIAQKAVICGHQMFLSMIEMFRAPLTSLSLSLSLSFFLSLCLSIYLSLLLSSSFLFSHLLSFLYSIAHYIPPYL